MPATSLARELYRRDPLLALVGCGHLAVLALVLVVAPFDQRTILGLNPWIKPSKFLVSVTIYMWTVAWFLPYLRGPRWMVRLISAGVALVMTAEIVCIVTQSARGVRSHFNDATPFDEAIFAVFTDLSTAVERSGSAPGLGPSEWDEQWPTSVSGAASVRRACRVLAEGPI